MNILKKRSAPEYHSDSDSASDSISETAAIKPKSRRPKENAFTQQKLRAYQPILTPKTVIPIFFALAIFFTPLGGAMLYGSRQVQEIIIQYQDCADQASSDYFTDVPARYVDYSFHSDATVSPKWRYQTNSSISDPVEAGQCVIQFDIPSEMGSPIYYFYKLENFYANHRRYVKSFSEDQLKGELASLHTIKDTVGQNCEPLSEDENGVRYYPCGLIANSLFNDTFTDLSGVNGTSSDYPMTREGIAWSTDKNRFKRTRYSASEVVPPPNWIKQYPDGYTEENMPDISTWYEFQNWMHALGLSTFSRLVLRNDSASLQPGTYETTVGLHFPVTEFDGKKLIYLSTSSAIGGKNSFLGVAWIVAGVICFLIALVFTFIHAFHPRKTGDLRYLSWNKESSHVALPLDKEEEELPRTLM